MDGGQYPYGSLHDARGTLIVACLCVLTAIALVTGLILGKALLAPIVLALTFGVVASPLADLAARHGVPRIVTALLMVTLVLSLIMGVLVLVEPAIDMVSDRLPTIIATLQGYLSAIMATFGGLEALGSQGETTGETAEESVKASLPTVATAIWYAPNFAAQFFIFTGTLFFFVLTRNAIYDAAPQRTATIRKADVAVSRYFGAVTLINAGLGTATAGVLALIGVEYPLIWGLAAALANFILYLGPICIIGGLFLAGLTQFGGAYALVPPFAFFLLNAMEAQFVTPMVVGQHVRINPLYVFLAIVSGLWIWGPVGAIVALPVVIWIKNVVSNSARA